MGRKICSSLIVLVMIISCLSALAPAVSATPPSVGNWVNDQITDPETGLEVVNITQKTRLMFEGTADEPYSTIYFYVDNTLLTSTTADANGDFEVTVTLSEGSNAIYAKEVDRAGNESDMVLWRTLIVDATSPAVTITEPYDGASTSDVSVVVSGTITDMVDTYDQLTVEIYCTGSTGSEAVYLNPDGSFSTVAPLVEGANVVTMIATDRAGNQSNPTVSSVIVTRTIQPVLIPTSLSISPSSFTLQSDNSATLTATLKDNAGYPLADKSVIWGATAGGLVYISTTTDSYGQISVVYTAPTVTVETSVTVAASFAGDADYEASSGTSSGTIKVAALTPTYLFIYPSSFTLQSGNSKALTATLYSENIGLAGRTITWSATSGSISPLSGTTDSYGQLSATYTAPTVTAQTSVTVTASFAGDASYKASSGYSYGTITVENVPPSTTFSPPHSDSGSDTDGDGYYNYLVVNVNLSVAAAGTYNLSAYLYDSVGNWITNASEEGASLASGPQTVALNFSGSDIYQSGTNGPYTVYINLFDSGWNWIVSDTHTTSTYSYTEFQPVVEAVSLIPPHSDRVLDNDGDGYYDYLVVDVNVNITTAGKYYLGGVLSLGQYDNLGAYAWREVTLSTGAQTVSLYFDGGPIRRAKIDGPYLVYLYIYDETYTSYESGEHTTSAYSYTSFTQPAVSLTPPHSDYGLDSDSDGLYDYLVIDVGVNIGRAGKYYVGGSLYGGATTYAYENYEYASYTDYVGYAWEEVTLSTGAQAVSLYFDGMTIKRSGINGPYTASLYIYDETYSAYDYGDHTTGTYTYTQFGRAATEFSPPHSDSGSDTNDDGLYDYLTVTVNLNVVTAGTYSISASLSGSDYTYIDYAWEETELSTGAQPITLKFDGSKIRQSKVDGPYTVDLSLDDSSWNWIDSDTHTTQSYTYTQFQTAAVALAPPHSDSGSDPDGDGYFNYLVVDVNLSVTRAGTYSVSGSLMGGGGYESLSRQEIEYYENVLTYGTYIDYAWEEAELSAGTNTVQLSFDGMRLRQTGVDGPYTVELYVYGPHSTEYGTYSWDWGTSDYGTHTTASYTSDQFQPSGASFSSPHSDSVSDTDGDGLYNYLVVSASVNVTTAGTYSVSGSLSGSEYTYIDYAWEEAELTAGTNTVELRFSGTKIRSSGINGPYEVSLSLSDSNWNWLGTDTHTTEAYSYTDFQGLPIEFSAPHTDSGRDPDGDGRYDYLAVDVGVNVSTAGTYLIVGTITPSYYLAGPEGEEGEGAAEERQATTTASTVSAYTPIIAMKQATLSTGAQTVQLSFPGGLIYQSGQNGPYYISLAIIDDFDTWSTFDYDYHTTTTAYSYKDFEPPVATLSPPHSDYGSDTDGDGLYDKLVVDVELNVRTAGSLKVLGFLMSSSGDFVDRTIKDVTLGAGQQSVELEFEGWKIYSSHVEGSLMVGILLLDPSVEEQVWYDVGGIRIPIAGWIGLGTHTTKTYSYDQFQSTTPAYTAVVIAQPVGQLSAGEVATIDLPEQLPTITGVRVAARENGVSPTISVTEETEPPAGVPEPTENVISYITITVENAEGQSFTLCLSRERIENLRIDPDTVMVFRFEDNWVEMSVEKISENEDYVCYEVTTPGFSLFAVTAQTQAQALPAQLPTAPSAPMPPFWVLIITALALVTVLIAVIWKYLSM